MTPKQIRFVDEYVLDGNAARAARKAGYSASSAKVTACRLLTKANLREAIAARKRRSAEKLELRKEHVTAALLNTYALAKEQADSGAMIAALREIARLFGFYDQATPGAPLSAEAARLRSQFESMSDEELLEIVAGGAVPR